MRAQRGGGITGEGTAGPAFRLFRLLLGSVMPTPPQAPKESDGVVSRRASKTQPHTCSLIGRSCHCATSLLEEQVGHEVGAAALP